MYISKTFRASVTRSPLHFLHLSFGAYTLPLPLQEAHMTVSWVTKPGPIDLSTCFEPMIGH